MFSKDKIINVRFNRERKGYSIEEVDVFLDEIVEDLTALENERKAEIQANNERMQKVQESENTLAQALLIAQKTANDIETRAQEIADKTVADAQAQADEIINNAKVEAYNIREKYEIEIADLKAELAKIKQFMDEYKASVAADMDRHKQVFMASFQSDKLLSASEYDLPVQEEATEPAAETEEEAEVIEEAPAEEEEILSEETVVVDNQEELITDNIETINLDDIIHGLPENDAELKALIDEIME